MLLAPSAINLSPTLSTYDLSARLSVHSLPIRIPLSHYLASRQHFFLPSEQSLLHEAILNIANPMPLHSLAVNPFNHGKPKTPR